MSIDVAQARADTPGCREVLHLNNAGAALMPNCVVEAQIAHIRREARLGGYEAKEAAEREIERTYNAIARLLNCTPAEIALVENATVAWDLAFHGMDLREGDRILTCDAEYGSNYIAFLQARERKGVSVEAVPSDANGQLDIGALEGMIDGRVKLIAVTHVPTNGGLVNPAVEIGRIARAHGIPFLLDACQSAGQMPLDVDAIGCDMLSATGRKFLRGPRGTGFLYVRRDFMERLDPPFLDIRAARWTGPDTYEMRDDARRFENWEFNYAAVIGLGVAVDYALSWGLEDIEARVTWLADTLRRRLGRIPGVNVADLGARQCGIVSFAVDGPPPAETRQALRRRGMHISVSDRHSTLLDMDRRSLDALMRASVHYYNTEEELDRFCEAISELRTQSAA
ncbi:aminotransferase class V-fold PLP-dependent enzyme [Ferruginivarius sediminum]|uniref:Aminotransferase class V-fold PLP-dependent enzyme n=1 Tax=Ferruginivarius sediminum TaxID=2661937 RepID=A0A369TE00_9PROT|nr:aminotransferase class V-fold PLP-dependent enzyme [Ferruginivarius sediminum]RDD61156.1 aminotransferase class V-fold PLP-dependent enzyme [Ferruginivarius sediminum]